jgi:hypothetical protein
VGRPGAGFRKLFGARLALAGLAVPALLATAHAQQPQAQTPPATTPAPAPARAGRVLIVQESNGFPGGEQATELARQQLIIIGDRLRVFDPAHGWALFVSLPDRTVSEVSTPSREYVEHPFSYYEKYRQDRAKALREQADEFVRRRGRMDDVAKQRALDAEYARMGGDPQAPGHIVARLERFPQDAKKVTILVDRTPREVTLEHYRIRENQAADPIFDLWTTEDLRLPVDVLAFWRALGTFAPEVSDKLQQVPGVVIECTAVLDTGTFKRRFQSRVLDLRTDDPALVPASTTLPAGLTKVTDQPGQAPQQEQPKVWSVMTGQPLDPQNALVFFGPDGRRYYVADREQRAALIRLLGEGKEPPFLRGPAGRSGAR